MWTRTSLRAWLFPATALAGAALVVAACGGKKEASSGGVTSAPVATGATVARGDAVAGAKVFSDAQCGSCHTLAAAGSNGTIGPNLNELKPDFESVVAQVTVGGSGMPSYKGQLSAQQIRDVAAYVEQSASH